MEEKKKKTWVHIFIGNMNIYKNIRFTYWFLIKTRNTWFRWRYYEGHTLRTPDRDVVQMGLEIIFEKPVKAVVKVRGLGANLKFP